MTPPHNIPSAPAWTVTANIVPTRKFGPGGTETRMGTKHFSPGTKVYIIDWYPGTCEDIIVVGLSRKPKRFIKVVIRADWVENLRIKLCYHPAALDKIYSHFDADEDHMDRLNKEFAQQMYHAIPHWQAELMK